MAGSTPRIRFGPYAVDIRSGELWKSHTRLKLQDLPFRVLSVLLERPGELVTRDELQARLWGGSTFVDFDHGLNSAVNKLRSALNDSASRPRYIETVGRRGYRFVASVEAPDGRASQIRCLAVFPFSTQSGDASYQYLGEALTELLSTSLGRMDGLRVVARSSVTHYQGAPLDFRKIGDELKVDAVITGWVRQIGRNLIAYVELVDVCTGELRWSERFSRNVSEFIAVEEEIGAEIARQLEVSLRGSSQAAVARGFTPDAEANQLYLRGRYLWKHRPDEGALRRSIECFAQAIKRQPRFALAHAGLAGAYAARGSWETSECAPSEAWQIGAAAVRRALELDPDLGDAHTSLGYLKLHFEWDWRGAEKAFKQAIALEPGSAQEHHWYSHLLLSAGRLDEALAESKLLLELEPFDLLMNCHLTLHYLMARDFGAALRQAQLTLELNHHFHWAYFFLGWSYEHLGEPTKAVDHFRRTVELGGETPVFLVGLAYSYANSGDEVRARKLLSDLERTAARQYVSSYELALIYARLGDSDTAFERLDTAFLERSGWLPYLLVDPRMDILSNDPRFDELAARVGRKRGRATTV